MPPPDASSPLPVFRPRASTLVNATLLVLALVALLVIAVRDGGDDRGVEVIRREAPAGVDEIRVHVGGAVAAPGVVTARPGDRVVDVIELAGGALPDADLDAVNLALRVRDEDAVHVPLRGEAGTLALLDLNTATRAELEALPGIGPARAAAIEAARPLGSVDDLLEHSIIPASVWEQIRTLVTVR